MKAIKNFPLELIFWIVALVLLAKTNPHQHHFSLCPLANLGITWCPGCGLGRSIAAIFQGDLKESFSQHWFGIPALLIIIYRVAQLTKQIFTTHTFKLKYKED